MQNPTIPFPKLPDDVIIEILTWLPVKPLLRFKCVCKTWRSLISSQQFATTHLENSKLDANFTNHRIILKPRGKFTQTPANAVLPVPKLDPNFTGLILKSRANYKQCSVNYLLYEPVSEVFDLSWPVETERSPEMVGSCNGLICVSMYRKEYTLWDESICNGWPDMGKELILWNPCTRICKELPDFGVKVFHDVYFKYGFGYDKSSGDYKVVGIFDENVDLPGVEVIVQVYSLRNDKWKKVKNFVKRNWVIQDPATFVNGKLYWIVNDEFESVDEEIESEYHWYIVSFDLETVEAEILQLPSSMESCYCKKLGDSGGSLMVLCAYHTGADVWIVDGCSRGNENWTKVVTVPDLEYTFWQCYDLALYVKNNGRVLFFGEKRFVIFDAKDGLFSYPEVRNLDAYFVGRYMESLVSPVGYWWVMML